MERSSAPGLVSHSWRHSTYLKDDDATWHFKEAIERVGLLVWSETGRFQKRLRDVGGAEKSNIATRFEKVRAVRIFGFAIDSPAE